MVHRIRQSKLLPGIRRSRALVAAVLGLALAACDKPPPPAVAQETPAESSREAGIAERERALAEREAALTAKEQQEKALAASAAAATEAAAAAGAASAKASAERGRLATERVAADQKAAARERATAAAAEQRRRDEANASAARAAEATRPIEVASGTRLAVALKQPLSSKTAQTGERVEAVLTSDVIAADGRVAVPAGATVVGTVTHVVSGSRSIGATPVIGLRFEHLVTASGQRIPISGELDEQGASERGRDTAKILGGAAAGAVIGNQSKNNDRGKLIGGLIGGAIGAIAAKNTGTEVSLGDGAPLTIALDKPFAVTPVGTNNGG